MAPKKPTMLQRQRALRKQQQQTKQQSAKQLPPKGQSSADSRQARGQRTTTAKAQAANQQRVIARGMEGFIRRGKAQDKLDAAAKGTQGSGTRTAGAGGGLAKRQSSAVSQRTSGKPATQGGRVTPSASGQASSNRVQQVRVRDLGSTKPKPMSGGTPRALPPGNQGGQLARVARSAATTAGKVGAAGKVLPVVGTLLTASGEVSAMADRQKRWNDYKARTGLDKKTDAQTGGTRRGAAAGTRTNSSAKPTNPPLSSTGVRTPKGNTVATGSPEYNRYRQAQLDATKQRNTQVRDTTPSRQSSTQSGGGSTQSRSSSGGSTSRPMPRSSGPASNAGMKNQDPKFRGNLFEKTFGYKPGQAPDQQKARFKSVDNKFGQDSGYETKTKVDGSKYADKKPDMKKVKEYDRLRRKYYD